ncbi:MAG: amidohydrolase family protein, partial [Oscillospiraceae bacterium]
DYHMKCKGRLTCAISALGPDRISREMLLELGNVSEKLDLPIHMHLSCGDREIKQMQRRYQKRSIPFLNELGLINSRMVGVHLSVATDEELRFLAQSGAAMVLCSGSEAIVDGNVPPAYEFQTYSTRLAIGSDQVSGGNTSNLFYEMKIGALLNKCKYHNPEVFQAWKMLRLATIDGARALGMGAEIGSLEAGKKADIIMLNMQHLHMMPIVLTPLRNIIPNLVYAANGSEVVLSMIDGKLIMENRKLLNLDEKEVIKEANIEAQKLLNRAEKTLFSHETAMNKLMKQNKI